MAATTGMRGRGPSAVKDVRRSVVINAIRDWRRQIGLYLEDQDVLRLAYMIERRTQSFERHVARRKGP